MRISPALSFLCGLALMALAGCAVPPPSAYVSSSGAAESGGQPLGPNAVGEACTLQAQGNDANRHADVYCGTWQQPSGTVRTGGAGTAAQLAQLATDSAWRLGIEQRYACGQPQFTTILDGVPAALMSCTRRQGGWPHVALVAASGAGVWYADGVLPALPAVQRAIGVLSGRISASAATSGQSSSADALQASRLAAQAFSSGDIGQYDTLMLAGARANQAERFAAAESAFRAALTLQNKALGEGNPNTATTLERLALQISNQGRFAEADRLFARAGQLAAKSDDPLAAPRLQHYLALNLINEGKYTEALAQLDRAASGYEQRLPAQVLNAKPRRLLVVSSAGFDDALANRELLAEPTIRGALAGAIEVRRYRSVVLRALGKTAEAATALDGARALAVGNNIREAIEDGRITRTAGAGDLGRGNAAGAAQLLGTAASTFRTALPRSRPLAETRLLEASAIAESAGLPAALAACQDGTQILRQEALGVSPEVIAPCLDVFAKSADADPAHRQELLGAMFESAQLAQGGVTGTQIAQATARLAEGARDPKVAEAIRRRQDVGAELTTLDRARDEKLQSATAAGVTADTAELDARIAATRAALADADAALQAASPNYGQLVQEVVPASAVLALLQPGEAFVAIDFSRNGGWTFALRDGQITVARVGTDAAGVARLVERIRAGVEPTTDAIPRFDTEAAFALYKDVLGGVAPQLVGMSKLVVAPTGPLLSIPFSILLTGPADANELGKAPWLLRQAVIAHVPAAANFVSLRKVAGTSHATQPWFGFGEFRPVTLAQAQKSFPGAECADSAALFAGLPPLPFASRELDISRQLLGGRQQDELLGAAFTAPAVLKTSLKNYRVLHFATHALLPAELKCQSEAAIVTSDPLGAVDASHALLTVSDVVGLDLDADTVILSACNSGGGAVSSKDETGAGKVAGESLSGLARAFFYAGARSLMVTHWSVNDQTAAYLVVQSMKQVATGLGVAEAMRTAQLGMLDDATGSSAKLAHPFYWAPFAIIGDGGVRKLRSAGL